ncbi:DDE-type integrase/transposase/recombinase [Labrys miyagiensis]|nr:DDE-type integrase/transposase/recombinase [Labrys miyagiensis]
MSFVKVGGKLHYLWRAVDHEGEAIFPGYLTEPAVMPARKKRWAKR